MKAIYFDGKLSYISDMPEPVPEKGEALIKVVKAGICRTDLEIAAGYMDFKGILGHEFVGVVEQADDSTLIGERVVGEINCGCGDCSDCRAGNQNHCAKRTVLGILGRNGAFAERIALPVKNLHVLPDSIGDEEAVFLEPLAAAYRIVEQVVIRSKTVLVLGDGKLGILIAKTLAAFRADVVLCGRHPEKMAIADGPGISTVLIDDLPDGKLFDITVDATGRPGGIVIALSHTRPGGYLIIKTTVAKNVQIDYNQLVVNEITIVGSRCGPFEHAIPLLETGLVKLDGLVEKSYPLEKGLEAFKAAGKPGAMKILLG